jgi:hypothetical protein
MQSSCLWTSGHHQPPRTVARVAPNDRLADRNSPCWVIHFGKPLSAYRRHKARPQETTNFKLLSRSHLCERARSNDRQVLQKGVAATRNRVSFQRWLDSLRRPNPGSHKTRRRVSLCCGSGGTPPITARGLRCSSRRSTPTRCTETSLSPSPFHRLVRIKNYRPEVRRTSPEKALSCFKVPQGDRIADNLPHIGVGATSRKHATRVGTAD